MQRLTTNWTWVAGIAAIFATYRFARGGHAHEGSAGGHAHGMGGERSGMAAAPRAATDMGHDLQAAARFGGGIGVVAE
jgi:hypothetical protein